MKNEKSLYSFFANLENFPAFTGVLSALLALGSVIHWQIGILLLAWILVQPKVLRIVSFIVCAVILTSYFLQEKDFEFEHNPPRNGYGYVETVLSNAIILNTDFGKTRLSYSGNLMPGDSVYWQAKWYPIQKPTVQGAFDAPKWMRSAGFVATGKLDDFKILKSNFTFNKISFKIKQKLYFYFEQFYEKPETGLLMGLLIGDRSGISDALQNDFRKTGLVHVLSISGFHIVMLAGMLTLFLRALRLPRKFSQILAIALMCIYAPITGGSAAVWRAVLMFCVIECSTLFQKSATSINALGVALTLILIVEPQQAFNAGFQLSAAATLGILLGQRIKLPCSNYIVDSSFVTLCATLSTLPLLIFHFQTFSPISWLGNLVVVPLVGFGMQAGVLSLVGVHPFICQVFADSATFLLRLASVITSFLADNPYASTTIGPWSLPSLFAFSIFISLLPFMKGINPYARRIAIACLLFLSVCFVGTEVRKNFFPSWSAVFLDVGQGDCIVLRTPAGRYYLVDTGPKQKKRDMANDKIIPYFRSQGISKLEAIIITHNHDDHNGNLATLLKEFNVGTVWTRKDLYKGLNLKEKMFLTNTEWNLTVLYPDSLTFDKNENNNSIALKAEGLGQSLLLTGDLEKKKEMEILQFDIKSDVMKIGHHGSKTSSSIELLERVEPKLAIISVAAKNFYRHPSPETISRLDSLKIPHYKTSEHGSITLEFTEGGMRTANSL